MKIIKYHVPTESGDRYFVPDYGYVLAFVPVLGIKYPFLITNPELEIERSYIERGNSFEVSSVFLLDVSLHGKQFNTAVKSLEEVVKGLEDLNKESKK